MSNWQSSLKFDPISPLISQGNQAILFFVHRDLLGSEVAPIEKLWELPGAQKIINKQKPDGSWQYPGGNPKIRSQENYDQIETYRNLGFLIEEYGLNRNHPAIQKAMRFLFSFQTKDGDIRGIYGNQYSPNYTAGIMELFIKAGYTNDPHIEKGFNWLLKMRQHDGGWTIPLRTIGMNLNATSPNVETFQPDKTKPFSHLVTGVVLRAFAAHPAYREKEEAKRAGYLLASKIFKKDNYPDRGTPDYWLRFTFPFWFTDLLSSLDSLSLLGLAKDDPQVQKGLQWFRDHQKEDGLWPLKILKNKSRESGPWIALAICRVFKRFYQ